MTLRRIFCLTLSMAALGIVASSCSDDHTPVVADDSATFDVTPAAINLTAEAQATSFSVQSTGNWSATSDADWCTLRPAGGLKNTTVAVTATVTANTGMEVRTANIKIKSGSAETTVVISQHPSYVLTVTTSDLKLSSASQIFTVDVEANCAWTVASDAAWLKPAVTKGEGSAALSVTAEENKDTADREGHLTFSYGDGQTTQITVGQFTDAVDVPAGYKLVWNDEFNDPNQKITDKWSFEVQPAGWVNNELQRYVAGTDGTAKIENGVLTLTAKKVGNEVLSARLNSKGHWTYGIMEARINLPSGKGTWPAFWMYPHSPKGGWPDCGEIDIMEEVGCVPNEVSSSIHCKSYNHVLGTQKTAARTVAGTEGNFHVYRLEWTEDYIRTYVDGVKLFDFPNDKKGNRDTWPFDYDFKFILNLAWGGNWGGMWGVDESKLPVSLQFDYVRVFQKL